MIEFGLKNWLPYAINNHDISVHIEMTFGVFMPHIVLFQSDGYQGCIHVKSEIIAYVLMKCKTYCVIQILMFPLTKYFPVNKLLHLSFKIAPWKKTLMLLFPQTDIFHGLYNMELIFTYVSVL